ncbi:MAG: NADH-quinone oxidoreductase subunit M [Spirochaetes bacterium]|nr:NADH-quinone oxidoreductase subunit M [Spirochaetota bacterium]
MIFAAIVIPFIASIVILALGEEKDSLKAKRNALIATIAGAASLVTSLVAALRFTGNYGEAQLREVWWILPGTGINFAFALDGLSLPLFITTAFLFFIAYLFAANSMRLQAALGHTADRPKLFWALLLMLEAAVLAVFSAYNYIVFFIFWELFLIPLVILMWRFGLEGRRRAALKFFIYTFVSSAFMMTAFAAIVYYTPRIGIDFDFRANLTNEMHTMPVFNQRLIFLFFMAAFLVKMPVFPLHAWLPLTHTQAPIGTLLLSGLFLKLGTYGVLRFVTPHFTGVIADWGNAFIVLGLFSMLYGSFVAYRQKSFRFVIAYSSLAHMGLLLAATMVRSEAAVTGAIIQNVAHSLVNALLFVVVCMHLARNKSDEFGTMQPPKSFIYWVGLSVAMFAAIGVPGSVAFVGEFFMLYGLSFRSWPLTFLAITTLIVGAVYMLRLFHKVRAQNADTSWRPNWIEKLCIILLSFTIIWFGVHPSYLGVYAKATAKVIVAGGESR